MSASAEQAAATNQPLRQAPLPATLTRFVGRQAELGELLRLLESDRLLTLTGAGGSGKTRLAIELLQQLRSGGREVAWVDLSSLDDPATLASFIKRALGISPVPGMPAEQRLISALAERPLLLALDNCEHLVDEAARLVDRLLKGCGRLAVLATSREALGVVGERAWLVPGLSLPATSVGAAAADPLASEAVQLFLDRAGIGTPELGRDRAAADAVVQICRRLDGLPLAIELAAARARLLSPVQIAERLDDRFRLLSRGERTAIPRHRTLRGVMDWSYALLEQREQRLLQRLAVFAGGCDLESVESVCTDAGIEPEDVLDLLGTLAAKSLLLVRNERGATRYHLLETVREYALEQLEASGELPLYRLRHAEHFLRLALTAEPHMLIIDDPAWIRVLTTERANLATAFVTLSASPDGAEQALQMVAALEFFVATGGLVGLLEARQVIETVLATGRDITPVTRARAWAALAYTSFWLGDPEGMRAPLERSLEILGPDGPPRCLAHSLTGMALCGYFTGNAAEGRRYVDAARRAARSVDERIRVFMLGSCGLGAQLADDHALAHELFSACVETTGRLRMGPVHRYAVASLGRACLGLGDRAAADDCFRRAIAGGPSELIGRWAELIALYGLVELAAVEGDPERAARLLGAANAFRSQIDSPLRANERQIRERLAARLGATLGEPRLAALAAEGASLDWEQAVALATRSAAAAQPQPSADGAPAAQPALRICALGPLQICRDGRRIEPSVWSYGKPMELLLLLLCHPQGRTREQVGAVLWPEATTTQVKNNFHVTLHHLRKALGGAHWVQLHGERYLIDRSGGLTFDVEDFEAGLQQAGHSVGALRAALEAYRGDFLDGENVGDWVLERREQLRERYLRGLLVLGGALAGAGQAGEAADVYARAILVDELCEAAHRGLIAALDAAGLRHEALRRYERLVTLLDEELGVEPEPETARLGRRLRRRD